MATDTEALVYIIFHVIRFILNLSIFFAALLFLLAGCFHEELRPLKRQWLLFNLCISMIIFAIINSVFCMLPLAPTYETGLALEICTLQHFFEDIAQGQVAYSFVGFCIHQLGREEWKNRSLFWFGICIGIQWLCTYLLPLPQILMSNVFICFAIVPNQFFVIYSVVFLLVLPVFLHLIIYIIMNIFNLNERHNLQIHPAGQRGSTGIIDDLLLKYILFMGLLFDIIGYGPKGILSTIDFQLKQSIVLYAALEILPPICLLIDIGFLYKINKEIPKKIISICRRQE